MGHLQSIGQVVSVGATLSLFSPLPSGGAEARSLWEPPAHWKHPTVTAQVATASAHAETSLPAALEEPVSVALDSRSARYARLASLWGRVEGFARMPEGWASEGALPPPREIVGHVGRLLSDLPEDLEFPQATASAEGEVGLTWFKGNDRLDAIASPDGHLTWALKVGDRFLDGDVLALASESFDPFYEALVDFYE